MPNSTPSRRSRSPLGTHFSIAAFLIFLNSCQRVTLPGPAERDAIVDSIEMVVVPVGAEEFQDLPSPVEIAAGGVESPAHQAIVTVQIKPALEGVPVLLQLKNGTGKIKHATLRLENGVLATGDSPLRARTGPGGRISGVLTSSDMLTECVVQADVLEAGAQAEVPVKFGWIWEEGFDAETSWTMNPEYLYDLDASGIWTNQVRFVHHRAPSKTAPTSPLDGHEIRFYVAELQYFDDPYGELLKISDTPESPSKEMSSWAKFPQSCYTDRNGIAYVELKVLRNQGVVSIKLRAYDWTVNTPAPPGKPAGPMSLP
jgi:hypothetical protein